MCTAEMGNAVVYIASDRARKTTLKDVKWFSVTKIDGETGGYVWDFRENK